MHRVRYLVNAVALVLFLSVSGFGLAQRGALRISTCFGIDAPPTGVQFDLTGICGVNAFMEVHNFGLFVQTLPRYGPFWDNWEIYPYRPNTKFNLFGINMTAWPGIGFGREKGAWFVRFQSDIVINFDFTDKPSP